VWFHLPLKSVEPNKIHRLFYPQVTVVLTSQFKGRIGGMAAIWCTPLSFKPPLIGVAIAPGHETYRIINKAKAFAINFVDFHFAKQVAEMGEQSSKTLRNKLLTVGFDFRSGKATGQPLLRDAEATLECRLLNRHRTGTHELVIGEVVAAFANKSFRNYWDFSRYKPLLYAGTEDTNGKCWVFRSGSGQKTFVPSKDQP
jgi:flavin reductase (DIM6/NTAB) family NADH-FMN oxidoreductase RutF